MSFKRFGAVALSAGLLLSAAATVAAHDGRGGGWHGWGMGGMMHNWSDGSRMDSDRDDWRVGRIKGRLAYIKAEIGITGDQETAWKSFAETVRTNAETHVALMRSMMQEMMDGDFSRKSPQDRLETRITHMEARIEQLKDLKTAFAALYDVLDDKQKATADEIALPMMGMGMGMGRGRGHRMMH